MSKVKINGKEYDCHSYSDKDIAIGRSIELIIEGNFKPVKSNMISIERFGKTFDAVLVLYHNLDDLAKVLIFVGEK